MYAIEVKSVPNTAFCGHVRGKTFNRWGNEEVLQCISLIMQTIIVLQCV